MAASAAPQVAELTDTQKRAALVKGLRTIAGIERRRKNAETDRTDAEKTLDDCGLERATLERELFKLGFQGQTFILDDSERPQVLIVHAAAVEIRDAERI